MYVFKRILTIALLLVGLLIVGSFFLPGTITVERSIGIEADVKLIFEQVDAPAEWVHWFACADGDSLSAKEQAKDDSLGLNSMNCWEGRSKPIGRGCLTIVKRIPFTSIVTSYDLTAKGSGTVQGEWTFEPVVKDVEDDHPGAEVYVSWESSKDVTFIPLIGKYMGWMTKKQLVQQMEESLLRLKRYTETEMLNKEPFELMILSNTNVLSIKDSCRIDNIGEKLRELYTELNIFMTLSELEYGGAPLTIYHSWLPEENFTILEAAIPVLVSSVVPAGRVKLREMPKGTAVVGSHFGLYAESDQTHQKMIRWIAKKALRPTSSPWEVYVTDPTTELDTTKWETRIYYPVESP
jgi:effector-binding domain-containing protein